MSVAPVLCIIQARYASSRLPSKMLQHLGDESLIERAVRIAQEAFGYDHTVVAVPASDRDTPLGAELARLKVHVFWFVGDERNVLGRFFYCANHYRWHPSSVIVRYTPDDPFKTVDDLRRVAAGERLPVVRGGEAFTLGQLMRAQYLTNANDWSAREHLTNNLTLFVCDPPETPAGAGWTVDTMDDLTAARERVK